MTAAKLFEYKRIAIGTLRKYNQYETAKITEYLFDEAMDNPIWHNISQEPKEAGLYALEFKNDGSTIRASYYNKLFTYIPHLKIFRYQNSDDAHDYQTFSIYDECLIAWQKIKPYGENNEQNK